VKLSVLIAQSNQGILEVTSTSCGNVCDPTLREARAAAGERLGQTLAKLDALGLPPVSDDEIEAEIQAARLERAVRRT
jgi:hypothetical protein